VTTPLNTITATIPVGANPSAMAVSPDGERLYVANLGDRTVSVIDTTINQVTATIPCRAAGLYGAAVSPDGNHLYLSDVSSLLVIDTATHQMTGGAGVDSDPSGLAFSADGQHLYVAVAGRKAAAVVDPATNDVTATIKVGDHPYYLALSPDGGHLYVANSGS
jgi:YVTN family beta-propeller protein